MKTVSLDLAKQLKEVGYPQKTEFCFYRNAEEYHFLRNPMEGEMRPFEEKTFASPTADEILDQLPQNFKDEEYGELTYCVYLSINGWNIDYMDIEGEPFYEQNALILADAAAKMWLYLKKENLI